MKGTDPLFPIRFIDMSDVMPGLTIREYFAGLAIKGLAANPEIEHWECKTIVKNAVLLADALIAELNKEHGETT